MDSTEDIRPHILFAARRHSPEARGLTGRILNVCWPAGPDDRSEPVARGWLSRWRPTTGGAVLPACSCEHGHCAVCN